MCQEKVLFFTMVSIGNKVRGRGFKWLSTTELTHGNGVITDIDLALLQVEQEVEIKGKWEMKKLLKIQYHSRSY